MAETIGAISVTIPSGQSQSAPIDFGSNGALRLFLPTTWDAAAVTVLLAPSAGGTYVPYYDDNGEYVVPNAVQGRCCWLDPAKWLGMRYVRLRSGTSSAPVNQSADRIIVVEFRPL